MIVVKIGGAEGNDLHRFVNDIPRDESIIIVHGGSDEMNSLSLRLDHSPVFITSPSGHTSRFTDRDTLDLITMSYSGRINKGLVELLRRNGHNALGLTGLDGGLLRGSRKSTVRSVENGRVKILRGDNTGKVESVNTRLLEIILEEGYLPVITIPIEAEDGGPLNADCDRVAAAVASSMKADRLILLTNQPGLLRDPADPGSLVGSIRQGEIENAMKFARGRMKKKILAAQEAVQGGVREVVISSSMIDRPIDSAMSGSGTVIS
ncbi:MAG: [LysW]-aminoadipate kinase [Thermoplasmatota archaeon]